MPLADNLERGFNLGYKSSKFAPLGDAIRSTIQAYDQQNQLESGLAAKAGMDRIFQDPVERQYKQAQLQGLESEQELRQAKINALSGGNVFSGGGQGVATQGGEQSPMQGSNPFQQFGIPEDEQQYYYPPEPKYVSIDGIPVQRGWENPKPRLGAEKHFTNKADTTTKKQEFKKEFDLFLTYDDLVHKDRPKVEGTDPISSMGKRTIFGTTMAFEKMGQTTPRGRASKQVENQKARLGLKLVRQAGDVGNIRVDERQAQEVLIPNDYDSYEQAETKRQYMTQLAEAVDNNDTDGIQKILSSLGVGVEATATESPTSPFNRPSDFSVVAPNGKTYTFDSQEKLDIFKSKAGL